MYSRSRERDKYRARSSESNNNNTQHHEWATARSHALYYSISNEFASRPLHLASFLGFGIETCLGLALGLWSLFQRSVGRMWLCLRLRRYTTISCRTRNWLDQSSIDRRQYSVTIDSAVGMSRRIFGSRRWSVPIDRHRSRRVDTRSNQSLFDARQWSVDWRRRWWNEGDGD